MITIGITGKQGAGKGTVVEYLEKKGFAHYSVREFLVKKIEQWHMPLNRDSMLDVANGLRKTKGGSYIIEELYKQAEAIGKDCVIESVRALDEVMMLKHKPNSYLFGVDADISVRYERIISRKTQTDKISFEKFTEDERKETTSPSPHDSNIITALAQADFIFINNGEVGELEKQIDAALKKIIK